MDRTLRNYSTHHLEQAQDGLAEAELGVRLKLWVLWHQKSVKTAETVDCSSVWPPLSAQKTVNNTANKPSILLNSTCAVFCVSFCNLWLCSEWFFYRRPPVSVSAWGRCDFANYPKNFYVEKIFRFYTSSHFLYTVSSLLKPLLHVSIVMSSG